MSNETQTNYPLGHNGQKIEPGMVLAYYHRLGWGEFDKDKSYFAVGLVIQEASGYLSFFNLAERMSFGMWSVSPSGVSRPISRDFLPPENFVVLGDETDIMDYMKKYCLDWTEFARSVLESGLYYKDFEWWNWPVEDAGAGEDPSGSGNKPHMNEVVLKIELLSNELRSAMDYCDAAGVNMYAYVRGVLFGGK